MILDISHLLSCGWVSLVTSCHSGSHICKGTVSPGDLLVPLSLEAFQVLNVCLSVCCHVFTPLPWLYLFNSYLKA